MSNKEAKGERLRICRANQEVRKQRLASSKNNWEQADTCGQPAKQTECETNSHDDVIDSYTHQKRRGT